MPALCSWDAVTESVGGTPLTGVTYNVHRGTKADGSDSSKLNASPIAELTYRDGTITSGVFYFFVTAVYQGRESGPSPLVRFSLEEITPLAPANFTVVAG